MAAEPRRYFQDLARWLKLEPAEEAEILRELSSHVEERAAELEQAGLSPREALPRALAELGHPQELARTLYSVHSRSSWEATGLAVLPHLAFALLFALHLWIVSVWVILVLISAAVISLLAWRKGQPRWAFPWLGYALLPPVVSLYMALTALGEALWRLAQGIPLPFHPLAYLGLLSYVPLVLWVLWSAWLKVIHRDWLYATLAGLPFPVLISWLLLLQPFGGPFSYIGRLLVRADGPTALLFVGLAVATAAFYRVGQRTLKVGILTLAIPLLVVAAALNHTGTMLSGTGIVLLLLGLGLILLPALTDFRLGHQGRHRPA
jgi:hypothetical protein